MLQVIQQKPHGFEDVPGIHLPPDAAGQIRTVPLRRHVLENQSEFLGIELIQHHVDRRVHRRVEFTAVETLVHDEPEIRHHHVVPEGEVRRLAGHRLVPLQSAPAAFCAGEVVIHRLDRGIGVELFAGDPVKFGAAHGGEAVGEEAVRRHGGHALPVEGEVISARFIPTVAVEEIEAILGDPDAGLSDDAGEIQFRKHVHDAPLHPHVFGGVVDRTVPVQTGEVAAVPGIHAVFFPKGDHRIGQFPAVPCRISREIHHPSSSGYFSGHNIPSPGRQIKRREREKRGCFTLRQSGRKQVGGFGGRTG